MYTKTGVNHNGLESNYKNSVKKDQNVNELFVDYS